MARKKHKAGRLPANHSMAGARTRRQHGAFAVFPPPACESPVWRHLWTLLAVGLALRLLAAFSADWINRADEIMQYLEQAHRFVFGAGFVPWEIRLGARNMLLIAPAVGVMQLCQAVGGGADCHIMSAWNCLTRSFRWRRRRLCILSGAAYTTSGRGGLRWRWAACGMSLSFSPRI